MYSFAQTNIQLFNQLCHNGYSKANLDIIFKAYELATSLFTSYFRANGKTFISHLVGTASILSSVHAPVVVVAAGLLHAAYMQGDFGDGRKGISNAKREQLRVSIGHEVEEYVARYTALQWNEQTILAICGSLSTLSPIDRNVVLIRLANELEDHLDLGIVYCASFDKRREYINHSGYLMVQIAEKLSFPTIAIQLAQVFQETNCAEIPSELRSEHAYSFTLSPKSYQKRLSVGFNQRLTSRLQPLWKLYFSSATFRKRK